MIKELFKLLIDCLKSPKQYIYNIVDNNITRHQLLLLLLIGIISSFNMGLINYFQSDKSFIAYFFHSVIIGGIFGWVGLYFLSYVVSLTGMLFFKTNTHGDKILNVFAYSYINILVVFGVILLEFILISFFGLDSDIKYLIIIFGIIKTILMIYCFLIIVLGVSKIQGLSFFKGFLTLFIPMFIFVILIMIIMSLCK
jgi:hypothetical protein